MRVGVIKVHRQVQASLQGGLGKDQEPEMRLLPQLFAWTLMDMLRLHCVSAGRGHGQPNPQGGEGAAEAGGGLRTEQPGWLCCLSLVSGGSTVL